MYFIPSAVPLLNTSLITVPCLNSFIRLSSLTLIASHSSAPLSPESCHTQSTMALRKKSRFEKLTEHNVERERQAMQGLVKGYKLQPVKEEDATGLLTKKDGKQ
jgi:hypothetical protein